MAMSGTQNHCSSFREIRPVGSARSGNRTLSVSSSLRSSAMRSHQRKQNSVNAPMTSCQPRTGRIVVHVTPWFRMTMKYSSNHMMAPTARRERYG